MAADAKAVAAAQEARGDHLEAAVSHLTALADMSEQDRLVSLLPAEIQMNDP
jgi:hypothetical protein